MQPLGISQNRLGLQADYDLQEARVDLGELVKLSA